MIRISQPHLESAKGNRLLISHITDEAQFIEEDIYYSVPEEYGDYLTYEVADSFVVGCLLPAVFYNQDIVVEGSMSEKLFYNLSNSVLYVLSSLYGHNVKIHAEKLVNSHYDAKGVGCGCSLGVDSFAAMLQHMSPSHENKEEAVMPSYKITHLTYFNVGAMGYVNLEKAKASYDKDIKMVFSFAKEVDLPVVSLESNFSLLYKDFDFDASGDLRNFSAALSLQKLFGKYLYGSSFPITDFRFDKDQTGFYESLLAPLTSTESTEIVIANPDMTRVDKTRYIVDNPLVQKYLYVCWKELIANKWPNSVEAKVKDLHLNCTRCDKCKRTLLAIDLLGKLDMYKNIFDIPHWNSVKDDYIVNVISNRYYNTFYKELYDLMGEVGYIPSKYVKRELKMIKIRKTLPYQAFVKIRRIIKQ